MSNPEVGARNVNMKNVRIKMRRATHVRDILGPMRTTIEFDDDTTRAIEAIRRERGLGVSAAVNELIRRGLLPHREGGPFKQRTARLGLRIDVSNVADALESLDGPNPR